MTHCLLMVGVGEMMHEKDGESQITILEESYFD